MFSVVLGWATPAPFVTAGTMKELELSMSWRARAQLRTYLVRVGCWTLMGKNRQASSVATVEIFPDRLD